MYKSCMNFEVKVVECASGRDSMSAGEEAPLSRCVLCVGVLQHVQKMHSGTRSEAAAAADSSILDPEELTPGSYEVLLYTVYNPDAEIEVEAVSEFGGSGTDAAGFAPGDEVELWELEHVSPISL